MNWIYKEEIVDESYAFPENAVGFIYRITRYPYELPKTAHIIVASPTKIYIGKKLLVHATKKKVGKREAARQLEEHGDKRKVKKIIRGTKLSNWLSYNSSSTTLQQEIKDHPRIFTKEILRWCFSKKELSYYEMREQFSHNVLEIDSYNDNIGGKFYRKDIVKSTTEI